MTYSPRFPVKKKNGKKGRGNIYKCINLYIGKVALNLNMYSELYIIFLCNIYCDRSNAKRETQNYRMPIPVHVHLTGSGTFTNVGVFQRILMQFVWYIHIYDISRKFDIRWWTNIYIWIFAHWILKNVQPWHLNIGTDHVTLKGELCFCCKILKKK